KVKRTQDGKVSEADDGLHAQRLEDRAIELCELFLDARRNCDLLLEAKRLHEDVLLSLIGEHFPFFACSMHFIESIEQLACNERIGSLFTTMLFREVVVRVRVDEHLTINRLEAFGERIEHREAPLLLLMIKDEAITNELPKLA